jgi:hypothetical protein
VAADYTFAPAPVLIETTGEFAIGVTGILRDPSTNAQVQLYDLNESPIATLLVGSKGAHQGFKADIPFGNLDFGSVILPSASLEQQAAALTAVLTANEAAADAATAVTTANEAMTIAEGAASPSVIGDITGLQTALDAKAAKTNAPYLMPYSATMPTRPNYAGPVIFQVPAAVATAAPRNGTTTGGTAAAANGDIFWTN